MRPAVAWTGDAIEIIDQTLLPAEVRILQLTTTDEVVDAIQRLAVRGAPALGVTGALGVLLARDDEEVERIASARPTAVNLRWAVERVLAADDRQAEALAILEEDVAACRAIGEHGRAELAARGARSSRSATPAGSPPPGSARRSPSSTPRPRPASRSRCSRARRARCCRARG